MASQWYYAIGDTEGGPVSAQELKKLADSGQLKPDSQVWKDGMAEWVAASTIPNLISASAGPAAAAPQPAAAPAPASADIGGAPTIDIGDAVSPGAGPGPAAAPAFDDSGFGGIGDAGGVAPVGGGGGGIAHSRRAKGGSMSEYLTFKKMITPVVIQIIFWLAVVFYVGMGLFLFIMAFVTGPVTLLLGAIMMVIFGPIMARIYCEILIVIFSINDTLTEIRRELRNR